MTEIIKHPKIGSLWKHHNGNVYYVICVTNKEEARQDKYPTTVVYQNITSGKPYSRKLIDWHGSMTLQLKE